MIMQNPFLTSSYTSPEYFCNREKETNLLINSAFNSLNYALFSLRRLGKTALIHNVFHHLKRSKIKTFYLDISATNSLIDFTYCFSKAFFNNLATPKQKIIKIASQIMRGFSPILIPDRYTGDIQLELKLIKPEVTIEDLNRIFEFLKNSDSKFLIAIDEFQQILNYPEKNFESYLRSKLQFMNNICIIFSGSKKHLLLSIFGDYSKPLWQSCNFMELMPIAKDEYYNFIKAKFLKAKKEIKDEALDLIFDITRGITFFVQLLCKNIFDSGVNPVDFKSALTIIQKVISEKESYYINYINLLTPKQLEFLIAIAKENGVEKPMSSHFLNKYHLGAATTVKSVIDNLTEKEVIYKLANKYYIADVLFSSWLKDYFRRDY